jgi:hypothetical protein
MIGHCLDAFSNARAKRVEPSEHGVQFHVVGQTIVVFGTQALSKEHREPAWRREEPVLVFFNVTAMHEERDFLAQAVGHIHVAAILPELGIVARVRVVVQDQKVAHALILEIDQAVEFVDQSRVDGLAREQLQQIDDGHLDQIDAGRFERFEEAASQAYRQAVASPGFEPPASLEADPAGFIQGSAVEVFISVAAAASSLMKALNT